MGGSSFFLFHHDTRSNLEGFIPIYYLGGSSDYFVVRPQLPISMMGLFYCDDHVNIDANSRTGSPI